MANTHPAPTLTQVVTNAATVAADRAALDDQRNGVRDSYAPLDFVERQVSRALWGAGVAWGDLDVDTKATLAVAYGDAYRTAYEEAAS